MALKFGLSGAIPPKCPKPQGKLHRSPLFLAWYRRKCGAWVTGGALAAIETAAQNGGDSVYQVQASNPQTLRSLRSRLRYLTPLDVRFADPVNRSM